MNPALNRRDFFRSAALASAGIALGLTSRAAIAPERRLPIIGFSKPFQSLNAEDSAAITSEIGWDGIECPVRAGGQIEPARVVDELPKFLAVFHAHKLVIPSLATDILSITQPHAETVLRTAAELGIKRLRLGFFKYRAGLPLLPQVAEFGRKLKDIGVACAELGLQAGIENHSGTDYFGGPIWDVHTALQEHAVTNVGYFFDVAHAMIEGGLSWPIQVQLTQPRWVGIYLKDFGWTKTAQGWEPQWCQLGDGSVKRSFVTDLVRSDYRGPICQHHEYELGNRAEMIAHCQRDLRVLKSWLA